MQSFFIRAGAAVCALSLACASPAVAEESSTRSIAPNTDSCPNSLTPPEPTTTSEALAPGQPSPTPLPASDTTHCGVSVHAGMVVPPEVLASAFLVVDLDTGVIVAMKDPHGRYRPASIIKVLLALVVIEELDLNKPVKVSHESAAQDGSAVGIGEGGTYTVERLLHGLLLASGNDAAHALAQELGGDAAALRRVNDLAQSLGTTDTHVSTYSGLDAPGMSSSAFDLALMYRAAFANPTFARIVGTNHIDFPWYEGHPGYQVWNDNGLLMNNPHGIGGKTGYTDDAHHPFVGALDRDGRRLMPILLDTTADSTRPWQQAQALLGAAYQADNHVATLEKPAPPVEAHEETPRSESTGLIAVVGVLAALAISAVLLRR